MRRIGWLASATMTITGCRGAAVPLDTGAGGGAGASAEDSSESSAATETETETDASTTSTSSGGITSNWPDLGQPECPACKHCGESCDTLSDPTCPSGDKCTNVGCEPGTPSWDSNRCVPVMGDAAPWEPCEVLGTGVDGLDTCGPESMCWNVDPQTGLGYCAPFCGGTISSPTCPDQTVCPINSDGTIKLCAPSCDPLIEDDCPVTSHVCVPFYDGNSFWCSHDASGGLGVHGTACETVNACNYGLLCFSSEAVAPPCDPAAGTGCCAALCDLTNPAPCPGEAGGEQCVAYFEAPAPAGYEHVGVCVIP